MTDPMELVDAAIRDPLASRESDLSGRVAVVAGGGLTGPEGGVGFAIAWLYALRGAHVAILDRDLAAAELTVAGIERAGGSASAHVIDLLDDAATEAVLSRVVDAYGRIDLLADSVAGTGLEGVLDATPDQWDLALRLNAGTAWTLIRHAAPRMNDGGAIVTISSGAADSRGPGLPYGIGKAALERLTIGVAGTLAPRRIRANCVRVGMIWSAFAARGVPAEQREVRRRGVAMATEGTVWDIASAALFLSTESSRWITGQVLIVDGGGPAPRNVGQAGFRADASRSSDEGER